MFEWDETKNEINIKKHHIDFNDAKEIWQGDVLEKKSPQTHHGEDRYLALGVLNNKNITVVYTNVDENKRLISARRSWTKEEKAYKERFEGEKRQSSYEKALEMTKEQTISGQKKSKNSFKGKGMEH